MGEKRLLNRRFSGVFLTLLLIGVLASAFNARPSKAEGAIHGEPDATGSLWLGLTTWRYFYGEQERGE